MPLNDHDSDISDDPEQDNEIEKDIDVLKERILEMVEKIITEQDTLKNYVLMTYIEDIAEFLGDNIVSERLLPYILSFSNLKDHTLILATLRGLRILTHHVLGNDEIKYIITSCDNLFYDLNELIVLEAINTVHYIIEKHNNVFDDNRLLTSMITKLAPFCLHPNHQIKRASVRTICQLVRNKQVSYIVCNVSGIIRKYMTTQTILKLKQENELLQYLEPFVSRFCFDLATNKFYFTSNEPCNLSIQDRRGLCLIQDLINAIPKQVPLRALVEINLKHYQNRNIKELIYDENVEGTNVDPASYIDRFYDPIISKDLDIKKNETNYDVNKNPKYFLDNLIDESLRKNARSNSKLESDNIIDSWKPQGRLINTLYTSNCNDIVNPITTIFASEDSQTLISGSQNGMINYFNLTYGDDEIQIDSPGSILITDQDSTMTKKINCVTIVNNENTFCVGMDGGSIHVYSPESFESLSTDPIHIIERPDEGSIMKMCNFKYDFGRENAFAYVTQKGFLHIHDLRVKLDVNSHDIGLKFGIPSAMSTANINLTNKIVIGTLGGFIHLYDVRYNIPMVIYEHSRNHPILDFSIFYPNYNHHFRMLEFKETQQVHCIIATAGLRRGSNHGGKNSMDDPPMYHEVSLMNIYNGEMKATFTVDDSSNIAHEPVEVSEFYTHDPISISRCAHSSKFNGAIYRAYASNYITKILCPRLCCSQYSVPYFISAGSDRKIRYWSIANNKSPKNYNISSPIDFECEYKDSFLGDIQSIQEKVTFKQSDISKNNKNISGFRKKKNVAIAKSVYEYSSALNEVVYTEGYIETSFQPFNTCYFSANKTKTDLLINKIPENAAHSDAILDLAYVQDERLGPYLFSAGRDGDSFIFSLKLLKLVLYIICL